MSHTVLKSFDPLATHPFTNAQGILPQAPHPHSYANRGSAPTASSLPTQQTPAPLHAPQPRPAGQATGKAIFTPFNKDRASPDLPAMKKSGSSSSWGSSQR